MRASLYIEPRTELSGVGLAEQRRQRAVASQDRKHFPDAPASALYIGSMSASPMAYTSGMDVQLHRIDESAPCEPRVGTKRTIDREGHNYIGHNCIDHDYICTP